MLVHASLSWFIGEILGVMLWADKYAMHAGKSRGKSQASVSQETLLAILTEGRRLSYYKGPQGGKWSVRIYQGEGKYAKHTFCTNKDRSIAPVRSRGSLQPHRFRILCHTYASLFALRGGCYR
jgi:hypothetical protein